MRLRAWIAVTLLTSLGMVPADAEGVEARVAVPVASVHAAPAHTSERVTQVLLWDRVLILKERGEWVKVLVPEQHRTPEGYPGWMLARDLAPGADPGTSLAVVVADRAALRRAPSEESSAAAWAYFGTRLPVGFRREGWLEVPLPGREEPAWVAASEVTEGTLEARDGEALLEVARRLEGTPYLWGGMSRQGIDCSGFTYITCRTHGYLIPRDADQQFELAGEPVEREDLLPGDLVFFGSGPEKITHVGFYVGDGWFYDSSGRKGVGASHLEDPHWVNAYVGARRILKPGR